jgi:integrase
MKLKLSKTALDQVAAPAKGRLNVFDTATPGLCVQITDADARTFYVVRWAAGKVKWIRLGPVSRNAMDRGLTVEDARSQVKDINSRLAAGDDPNAEKRSARDGATLVDLWNTYLATYATPHKKPSSVAEDTRNYHKHLEAWGKSRRLTDITQADVKTLHTRIGETAKTAANRVLALLSGMFSKSGKDLGIDPRDNPARGVTRFTEKERDRVLATDEIGRLMAVVETEDPAVRDYIKISLYTGARRSNVVAMKWQDLNLKRATWKIPGEVAKGGDPMVVALAPVVVEILDKRPDDSPYVFPVKRVTQEQVEQVQVLIAEGLATRAIATKTGLSQTQVVRMAKPGYIAEEPGHMSPPKSAWEKILKAAGIKERTTLHDLRRTFATWMIQSGASLTVVAAAMGHKDIRTTQKFYAWADLDTVKTATFAGVDALTKAASVTEAKPKVAG